MFCFFLWGFICRRFNIFDNEWHVLVHVLWVDVHVYGAPRCTLFDTKPFEDTNERYRSVKGAKYIGDPV